ncbi:hypothetical protein D3C78_1214220 [compost metagenome]
MGARAVVVVEGEVHGVDALHVVGVVGDRVRLAHGVGGVRGQFLFQRRQEGREDVDHEAVAVREHLANVAVDDGVEDDRAHPVCLGSCIDLLYHCLRFFRRIDVWSGQFVEVDVFKLRQQTLAKRLGSDAGAVGNEESGAFHVRPGLKDGNHSRQSWSGCT